MMERGCCLEGTSGAEAGGGRRGLEKKRELR
jgi:hypothetical protein